MKKVIYFSSFGFLVAAFLSVTPALWAKENVASLLSDAKQQAFKVQREAQEMVAANDTRQASRECNVGQLRAIKENTNKFLRTVSKLNSARSTASPSEQAIIGRMDSAAKELAKNVQVTFEHLKVDKGDTEPIVCTEYRDYVKHTAEIATAIMETLSEVR